MSYELIHSTSRTLSPGRNFPRGATVYPDGVNFAIFSRYASEVFLLLFDEADGPPTDIIRIENRYRFIWHVFVHGIGHGQLYALKMRGPFNPSQGMRFNEKKLLVSPYAKAITGKIRNVDDLLFAYNTRIGSDLVPDIRDNTMVMPKAVVMDDAFDWQGDEPPEIPVEDLVIYEAHLRGFTANPNSGVAHPGTYLGFIEKIPYLKSLGINAVEFLPMMEFYVEDFLVNNGKTNYWGYNTVCFFAPESSYATMRYRGSQVDEFKTMVRELHKAGIEVIMDVVYNHTGEGNERGPTISFKGIDNQSYYYLAGPAGEPYRYYLNYTGCGNSLRVSDPNVLMLVMDSLRYWVEVMHVDGFRFDLASVLGRGSGGEFQQTSSFFTAVSQDPVLSQVKLIAEPWDMGTYQVGNFPPDWCEWNGRFRDTVRKFVAGMPGQMADLGWRLTGSADLYGDDGRSPFNSINFITCHDGFTLNDLVSYNEKHNEANGEYNNDGSSENYSWNCGVEGETERQEILELRRRQAKNLLFCLILAAGTPMLLAGDEVLRTQKGNNNAYCQDNELGWFDWSLVEKNRDMFEFTRKLIALRQTHPMLRRRSFFLGCWQKGEDQGCDILWYDTRLGEPAWNDLACRTLCFQLFEDPRRSWFFILNADEAPQEVLLPSLEKGRAWKRKIDTSLPAGEDFVEEGEPALPDQVTYRAEAHTMICLVG